MDSTLETSLDKPPGPSRLRSAFAGTARAALATYRLGGMTLVAAPAIVALAVVPELVQHVAEIRLGMFESKDAFKALAEDPTRWAFGYAKVAGFVLAILATVRYRALGSVRAAFLVPPRSLLRILFAIGLTFVAALPFEWVKEQGAPAALSIAASTVSWLIQGGLLVYLVATLTDDRTLSIRRAFAECWPTSLLLLFLAALAFVPAQALHMYNHMLAIGQPAAIVWALMLFDSLWVGLLAALLGSALFVGYRAGPGWRGWTARPA